MAGNPPGNVISLEVRVYHVCFQYRYQESAPVFPLNAYFQQVARQVRSAESRRPVRPVYCASHVQGVWIEA